MAHKSNLRTYLVISMFLLAIGLVSTAQAEPKYVIFLIGDGMGFEQVKAAGMHANGEAGTLSFEAFPYNGELTTYSANASVTDSAAAATALATGVKVNNGVVSMAYPGDGSELETLLEYSKAQGKSTGLVTTKHITDATPACFGAHEPIRMNFEQIADDYRLQTQPNVLFGGGEYGMTVDEFANAGYTVVTDNASMQALDTENASLVSGQFGIGPLPFEPDLGLLPHLSEMTTTALSILDNDPDGFFLMVEGGRIDHACHSNDTPRAVLETVEFDNTVQVTMDWAAERTDTLILVTADHETGRLTVLANNGAGVFPTVDWGSTDHTAANVPVYAWGVNAEMISGIMDNTDMFRVFTGDPQAWNPYPADGAVHPETSATLSWNMGAGAVSHDVYFGESFNDVNDGISGTFQRNQTETSFTVGLAEFPYSDGLVPDTTYYWRIDEINDLDPNRPCKGDVWSFMTAPAYATQPDPANDGLVVVLDTTLSWLPGLTAATHDVYFGTSSPPPFIRNQAESSYDPGPLELSTTYYWRIDEIEADGTIHTGDIWSFKTPTPPPPEWTCLDIATTGGITSYESTTGTWTIMADGVDIWGNADQFHFCYQQPMLTRGDCTLIARVESVLLVPGADDWCKAGLMIRETLDAGSKFAAVYITPTKPDGTPTRGCRFQMRPTTNGSCSSDSDFATYEQKAIIAPYWVKLERTGNDFNAYYSSDPATDPWHLMVWSPQTIEMADDVCVGLAVTSHSAGVLTTAVIDNVSITTPDPRFAGAPDPADGATNVSRTPTLSWLPGVTAASHDVYFSDSDPPAFIGNQTETSYSPPGRLDRGKTYYWRIDEVEADGTTKYKGGVWSFTTAALGR